MVTFSITSWPSKFICAAPVPELRARPSEPSRGCRGEGPGSHGNCRAGHGGSGHVAGAGGQGQGPGREGSTCRGRAGAEGAPKGKLRSGTGGRCAHLPSAPGAGGRAAQEGCGVGVPPCCPGLSHRKAGPTSGLPVASWTTHVPILPGHRSPTQSVPWTDPVLTPR